ncbi:MAG: SH3 domain-containing protein [Candidatus Omnitrophota bacterium]
MIDAYRINRLKHIIPAVLIFAFWLQFNICPAQPDPPLFQGEVNADNINLRSDSSVTSEVISILNKNEKVEVVLELYEWYKIRLPKPAPCYIKKNLAECSGMSPENKCKNARVLKNKVNIRLHPAESSPILGVADKNETVNVIKEKGDWYKIEPTQNSFGWINKIFINKAPVRDKKVR